jgi:dihydroxy-acid dehydratase
MRRSERAIRGKENGGPRALFKSMGFSDEDLQKPIIGIANSWNNIVPGHFNLNTVSEYVKKGIHSAGGTALEFGVIAECDGVAEGHVGMHYVLPSREVICNSVELMVQAHQMDAIVLLASCDKIVPGMLMAAARLDIPAIVVTGGPMAGGCSRREKSPKRNSCPLKTWRVPPAGPVHFWERPTPCAASPKPWE